DKYGFVKEFKNYKAEYKDENQNIIKPAITAGGNVRYIKINSEWEYFKAKEKERLYSDIGANIYARRKIDVESVFGHLKSYLKFTKFTVRGNENIKKQMGFVLMAMNIGKLAK